MFDVLVERKHPRLIEVFDRLECSLGGLTGEWFSRMFTTALPAETTARVWDCVMVEGPKVLFRAALSLIKVCSPSSPGRQMCSSVICTGVACLCLYAWRWHVPSCACCTCSENPEAWACIQDNKLGGSSVILY